MRDFGSALTAWQDSQLNAYLKTLDDEDRREADIEKMVFDDDEELLQAIRSADPSKTIWQAAEAHYERIAKRYVDDSYEI